MSKCSCGAEMKDQKFCKACGAPAGTGLNDKKARVMNEEKSWKKPLLIAVVAVLIAGGAWTAKGMIMASKMGGKPMFAAHRGDETRASRLTQATAVTAQNGDVAIPAAVVEDGKAHFFAYAAGGKTITFYAMKAADGTIKTAFDACVACNHAKLGYRQEGDMVVCNNCGMAFRPEDIGKETGGCNPIPVERSMNGQMIVLKTKDLEAGAQYF